MTRPERESIISWDEESQTVSLYSCVKSVWRKAEKAGWERKFVPHDHLGREVAREYTAPVELFRFRCLKAEAAAKDKVDRAARAAKHGFKKGGIMRET